METERRVVEEKSIEIRLRNKKKRTKKVESLYLCFNRTMMDGPGRFVHFVLAIKLTDLFSSKSNDHPGGGDGDGDGDGKGEGSETIITIDGNSKFRQVGYIEGDVEDAIPLWTSSGVFRSKIIIAGVAPRRCSTDDPKGTNKILVFDPTADPHPEPDSNNIRIKPFQMTEGGRRLCLFMHKFFSSLRYGMFPVEFPQYSDKGLLLVVPFEYKIINLGSDSCSVTANFEALRIIEFTPKRSDHNSNQILDDELFGAFVL
ncbi:hypothetical protein M0R45_016544 [Rubus argutus]|uniref:Uncharacterized protein n=1 Tax=Rubus argutus TaxID=59490 RepID=A0AAW1XTD6_RUBAR